MRLSNGVDSIWLTDELILDNEYWQPVAQSRQRLLDGAQCIQESALRAGKKIILHGADDTAWIARSETEKLQEWASIPQQRLVLTRYGQETAVTFLHEADAPAVEAKDLYQQSDAPTPERWMLLTLRLITI